MRNRVGAIAFIILIGLGAFSSASAVTIDTTPGWKGGGYIFGAATVPGNTKYGQVFTVPVADNIFDSFTFFISGSTPPVLFRGEIAPWNPTTFDTGPLLYASDIVSNAGYPPYNGTVSNYGMPTFTIPGGLALVPGAQYAAIMDNEVGSGAGAIGNNFDVDTYTGGYQLFWSGSFWYNNNDTRDYAFLANLSAPVPEPASGAILITGLLGLLVTWAKMARPSSNTRAGARPAKWQHYGQVKRRVWRGFHWQSFLYVRPT